MNEEYTIPPVAVLGSTGSVGRQTLDVCHRFGVRVDALTGGKNTAELEKPSSDGFFVLHGSMRVWYN